MRNDNETRDATDLIKKCWQLYSSFTDEGIEIGNAYYTVSRMMGARNMDEAESLTYETLRDKEPEIYARAVRAWYPLEQVADMLDEATDICSEAEFTNNVVTASEYEKLEMAVNILTRIFRKHNYCNCAEFNFFLAGTGELIRD